LLFREPRDDIGGHINKIGSNRLAIRSTSSPIRITKCCEREICGAREVKTMVKYPLEIAEYTLGSFHVNFSGSLHVL